MKTVLIDTNYFLRFILKDSKEQSKKAYDLFLKGMKKEVNLISTIPVFFEIYWVLSSFYKQSKRDVSETLTQILKLECVTFENERVLLGSLMLYKNTNLDLEDCYNAVFLKGNNIDSIAPFDKKLKKVVDRL